MKKNEISFIEKKLNEPKVIRGGASEWPAMSWTFESLRDRVGNVSIPVHTGRWKLRKWGVGRDGATVSMSASAYLTQLIQGKQQNYLAGRELLQKVTELRKDFNFPDVGLFAVDVVWIGPAGTVTPTHYDLAPNIYVQLKGRKRWQFWHPTRQLKPRFSGIGAFAMSKLDVGHGIDSLGKADLDWILEPGDMLLLPSHWWHRVDSLADSIAVNRWWRFAAPARLFKRVWSYAGLS